jgi:predicted O-methyltransferase YrrM
VIRPDARVFLGMPGYGERTAGAARGFWRSTRRPDSLVRYQYNEGSLLAANFNILWCAALNQARSGGGVDYFAMQHADIEPEDYWLDKLIEEMEEKELDVLGVVAPIKDAKGVTSTALARPDGDTWRIHCRLTMAEIHRLPPTFTSEDVGHPLLLNTGLWVCRFDEEWAKKVRFTINDRIAFNGEQYVAQTEPEDWYFSRLCHELGLRIGCTRKIQLDHRGIATFANTHVWGTQAFDSAYVSDSVVPDVDRDGFHYPKDVDGWLRYEEGKALWELARGKRVLEIGSYMGLSTICLAQTALHVHAIDPHDGRGTFVPQPTEEAMRLNLARYGVTDKVTIDKGALSEDEPDWFAYRETADGGFSRDAPQFDLIFIDGAHDYESVARDIRCTLPYLAPGGLLAFHDYHTRQDPGVTQAVDELLSRGGELLKTHASLAVVRPPAAVPLEV